jgi:hypothetical protein
MRELWQALIERISPRSAREHELLRLETVLKGILDLQHEQTEIVRAVAEAAKANADVLHRWFDNFVVAAQPPAPQAPVEQPEGADAWLATRRRLFEDTQDPALLEGVPPEIQLAWTLRLNSSAFLDDDDRA